MLRAACRKGVMDIKRNAMESMSSRLDINTLGKTPRLNGAGKRG